MAAHGPTIARRSLFCAGHFGKSIVWSFCDLLMLYYLHARLGLSGDMITLVMVPALFLSGVLDVVLGRVLCRLSPRQILAMQVIGAVATGFGVVVLFAINTGDIVALLLTMIGFRIAYTLYDVTQNALTSLLPANEADARQYVTLRVTLSSLARLVMATAAVLLIGDAAPLVGWEAIMMLPAATLAIASSLAMTRVPLPIDAATSAALPTISALPRDIAPLLAAAFFHAAALSMPARFMPFIAGGQVLLFVFVAGTLVGPIAANVLTAMLGRARGLVALATLTITGLAGLAMPTIPFLAATGIAIHGIGVGGTAMLLWGDMSRIVRNHAHRTGERADLPAFALLTSAIKIGIAVSTAAMAWLVDAGDGAYPLGIIAGIAAVGALAYVGAMRSGRSREYSVQRAVPA